MDPNPPPLNQDEDHLRLLVTFHKVIGIIYGVMGFCGFPHLIIGLVAANNPKAFASQGQSNPPPDPFYWFFVFAGLAVILGAWLFALLNGIASKRIQERNGLTFVYIVSALNCLWMPIGTALGVFTFIVINRPSVRAMFPSKS